MKNKINLPGFIAEVSVFMKSKEYQNNAFNYSRSNEKILPQDISGTGGLGAYSDCMSDCLGSDDDWDTAFASCSLKCYSTLSRPILVEPPTCMPRCTACYHPPGRPYLGTQTCLDADCNLKVIDCGSGFLSHQPGILR